MGLVTVVPDYCIVVEAFARQSVADFQDNITPVPFPCNVARKVLICVDDIEHIEDCNPDENSLAIVLPETCYFCHMDFDRLLDIIYQAQEAATYAKSHIDGFNADIEPDTEPDPDNPEGE